MSAHLSKNGYGHPLLTRHACAVLLCLFTLLASIEASAVTITATVAGNNDDAEEAVSDGNMDRGSTDLELVHEGSDEQLVGIRFRNLAIPPGSSIVNARIQFTVDEVDTGSTNVIIRAHDTGDAPTFSNNDDDISDRTTTTAQVPWQIPPWASVGAANADQRTPDLSDLLNEVVSRPDWVSGNDVAFIIEAGLGCNSSACQRTAESRNGSVANAPQLTVEFVDANFDGADLSVVASVSSPNVTVGGNFAYNITITNNGPQPATNVALQNTLSPLVSLQSTTVSQGNCLGAPNIACALGDIASGASASLAIIVRGDTQGLATNLVDVSATEDDPTLSNNSQTLTTSISENVDQLCFLVADAGGSGGGNDLLTELDTADFNPATNEQNIGVGTGTNSIEAIAWNSSTLTLFAANADRLGILSTNTGVFSPRAQTFGNAGGAVGNVNLNDVDGLSYDATSGVLFGVHARTGSDLLFQVNMNTGAHVPNAFGPGQDYVVVQPVLGNNITDDIAVDPTTGILYASVNSGGSSDRLIIIDKNTGTTTDVAGITVPDIEGLGVDPTGQLWGTSGTQGILYEISRTTGVGSFGRPIDNGTDYEAVDCQGTSPSIVADISVSHTVDLPVAFEGDTVTFTIATTNLGTGTATALQLQSLLPANLTLSNATVTQGIYDPATGAWFVGSLASGATATLVITAVIDAGASGQTLTNTANVAFSAQSDPDLTNNQANASVNVGGIIITKEVEVTRDPISGIDLPKAIPGSDVRYRVIVSNATLVATDPDTVIIVDQLPSEVELILNLPAGPIQFIDGTPSSGLNAVFTSLGSTTDNIDFSEDGGASWDFNPSSADTTDPRVNAIRIRMDGVFSATSGAGTPNFTIEYEVRLK